MKHLVNGEETELAASEGVTVSRSSDRLIVRTPDGTATALAVRRGGTTYVSYKGRSYKVEKASRRRSGASLETDGECRAPMPGQIVEVLVHAGDAVVAGDRMLILEAMKMQQPVVAPTDGAVSSIVVSQGDQVMEGQVLAVVRSEGEA